MRKLTRWVGVGALSLTALSLTAVLPATGSSAAGATAPRTASAARGCPLGWGSLPKQASTPVDAATLTNVRAGQHECFDRLVLDGASSARVRYVDQVLADGSGRVVPLRGGARLQIITVQHDGYDTTYPPYRPANPRELAPVAGFRTFRQVVDAGTFEGVTTIGLGVRARLPFRVFVLRSTVQAPRTVIDVAHHW